MLTIASHTIDDSIVPLNPTVLDVGCRDFDFALGIKKVWPNARVFALDPDRNIKDPELDNVTFICAALTGKQKQVASYVSFSTGHGNFITGLSSSFYESRDKREIPPRRACGRKDTTCELCHIATSHGSLQNTYV